MSDQDDIFNTKQDKNNPGETPPNPSADPFTDLLMEIKGEDGQPKYKSVEDALKALNHAQQFIKTLQTEKQGVQGELETMREELKKMGNIEDFINRLKPPADPTKSTPTGDEPKGLSEEDIKNMLEKTLLARENEQKQASNLQSVIQKMSELHGDKAAHVIAQRAKELNTTSESLRELAKTNPSMALALLQVPASKGVQPSQSSITLPRSTNPTLEPPVFEKSAARGGLTNKELRDRWNAVGEYTRKRLNVET